MPDRHPDTDLLRELEPVAGRLLDRHLSMAKEWMPHEHVPWSLGRDFDVEPWTRIRPRLTGVAQAASSSTCSPRQPARLPLSPRQAAICGPVSAPQATGSR